MALTRKSDLAEMSTVPSGSVVKNPPVNAGDTVSVPESGRSPAEGNGNPLQYSYLGNPMDKGAWQATVRGVTKPGRLQSVELQRVRYTEQLTLKRGEKLSVT